MRIAVLGTGTVGRTLAGRLVELGHEVCLGARSAGNQAALDWAAAAGDRAACGSFADAAGFGELVVNATAVEASLEALRQAGEGRLRGKVLLDVANPLDRSGGFPPSLTVANTDSLGERIQAAFPEARVVKSLNTVSAAVMVDPGRVAGDHVVFVSGDDGGAKREVTALLEGFGWPPQRVVDLGDIRTARGAEMYLALWLRLMASGGTADFNIAVCR